MRRANGTGSITFLSGNRRKPWAVRKSYKTGDYTFTTKYLAYFKTASEAQKWLERYNAAGTDYSGAVPTVGEIYQTLWESKYEDQSLSVRLARSASWERLSHLAKKPIDSIRFLDWQKIIDSDKAKGLSTSAALQDKTLMHEITEWALKRELVEKDYVPLIEMYRSAPKQKKAALSDEQIERISELAEAGFAGADMVLFMLYSGVRKTELFELRAENYDEAGKYIRGGIKTAAGKNRIIPIHSKLLPIVEARLKAGTDYLFTWNGKKLYNSVFDNVFASVMQKAGCDPEASPHWTRHTFATRAAEHNMDRLALKLIIGHSTSKDVTDHYASHFGIEKLHQELEKLP